MSEHTEAEFDFAEVTVRARRVECPESCERVKVLECAIDLARAAKEADMFIKRGESRQDKTDLDSVSNAWRRKDVFS